MLWGKVHSVSQFGTMKYLKLDTVEMKVRHAKYYLLRFSISLSTSSHQQKISDQIGKQHKQFSHSPNKKNISSIWGHQSLFWVRLSSIVSGSCNKSAGNVVALAFAT